MRNVLLLFNFQAKCAYKKSKNLSIVEILFHQMQWIQLQAWDNFAYHIMEIPSPCRPAGNETNMNETSK